MNEEKIKQLAEEISFRLLATRRHPEHQWLIGRLTKVFNKHIEQPKECVCSKNGAICDCVYKKGRE